MNDIILSCKNLRIEFSTFLGTVKAIRGVSFNLKRGETLAIVGESGSGKSVTTRAIMGILAANGKITSGQMLFNYKNNEDEEVTEDLNKYSQADFQKKIRGKKIGMIFQDPMTSLNPTMKIGKQIMECLTENLNMTKEEAKAEALSLIDKVGIKNPERRFHHYPHQLSGGMRQRIVIAIALASKPDILICDEPTTALDVTIQAQILELIKDLQKETGVSIIFITHDLGVVANVADRVVVMYAGKMIEYGTTDEVFYNPLHPYTKGLLKSMPDLKTGDSLYAIPGTPPNLLYNVPGDSFAPRNEDALQIDTEINPPLFSVTETHLAATWSLHPYAEGKTDLSKCMVFDHESDKLVTFNEICELYEKRDKERELDQPNDDADKEGVSQNV